MGSIEFFVVLAVRAFDLAVVPWSVGTDELVVDAQFFQGLLKKGLAVSAAGVQAVGKFKAVVSLNALNSEGEFLHYMAEKDGGGIGVMLLEGFQVAETGELVQTGILIPLRTLLLSHHADPGNEFHIDLTALSGVLHLFIGLWNILGVRQLDCHFTPISQNLVQSGNR